MNVLGAVDAVTKEVFTVENTTYITAETVKVFLQRLRDMTPDIPIAVVMDNARYQHCKAVMDKAKNLGIKLLFLPPYSPNLNIGNTVHLCALWADDTHFETEQIVRITDEGSFPDERRLPHSVG